MTAKTGKLDVTKEASKALLYSEYINTSTVGHVIEVMKKEKAKPVMQYMKSSVIDRVNKLIDQMKQCQEQLNEDDHDIENVEGSESVIEMDVALFQKSTSEDLEGESCDEKLHDETDFSDSESECDSDDDDSESSHSSSKINTGNFKKKLITELEDSSHDILENNPPKRSKII